MSGTYLVFGIWCLVIYNAPMPYLEVLNGPQAGQQTTVHQETFFIGRDANNHLVLSDRTISRKHAVINQVEGQFVLSDLKSLKGILVNGSKTQEVVLQEGDEITLGALRLHFYLMQKGELFPASQKQTHPRKWIGISGALLLLLVFVGGGFYYFQKHKIENRGEVEQYYLKGVELFNEHNIEGAKREWEKVLAQDPNKTTPYGQKASKLLESVGAK